MRRYAPTDYSSDKPGHQLHSTKANEESSKVRFVTITELDALQRIDNYLLRILKGVPKSRIYRIIRRGEVRVNGGRIDVSYKIQAGDVIRVPPVRLDETPSESPGKAVLKLIESAIMYEDADILALNKPAGVAVHGGSGLSYGVIEALRALRPEDKRLELVHRLDRGTSGVLLVAKKPAALRSLHEQLRNGTVHKTYSALGVGKWKGGRREVAMPLKKNVLSSGERIVRIDPEGKEALTIFDLVEKFNGYALVDASPVTGRTHQIRVHAAYLGCPLAGDEKYGEDANNKILRDLGLKRMFLHAARIEFEAPSGGRHMRLEASLDKELASFVQKLRQMNK